MTCLRRSKAISCRSNKCSQFAASYGTPLLASKHKDFTALFGACCGCGQVLAMTPVVTPGEAYGHPHAILEYVLSLAGGGMVVGQPNASAPDVRDVLDGKESPILQAACYDIACMFLSHWVACVCKAPLSVMHLTFSLRLQAGQDNQGYAALIIAIGDWHAKNHVIDCRDTNSIKVKPGVGLPNGDNIEQIWGHLRPFGGRLRYRGAAGWKDGINDLVRAGRMLLLICTDASRRSTTELGGRRTSRLCSSCCATSISRSGLPMTPMR
jgi:hypothetical protein